MLKFLGLIFVVVTLQTYLSRRNNKLLGLLLPMVNLIYSMVVIFRLVDPDIMGVLTAFVLSNVSTVMLMVVYFTIKKTTHVDKEENI